jgi:hypothetical protein
MLNLNMLKFKHQMEAFPKHCWWEISAGEMERAMLQSRAYSNDIARRNAYISDLCLKTVVNWLETELQAEPLTVMPSKADLPSIWEFLPGVAIQLGQIKLVLIPSETLETDQFSVPFEWVDISPWAADYYLAVQMNLEDDQHWMRIWGFTTHKRLKLGTIDPVKRLYKIDAQDLTQDLNVLWAMGSIAPAIILPSPGVKLSLDRLNSLLEQLSQPKLYSPRLELPFDQWSVVIANDHWRRILCDRRQQSVVPVPALVNLRQWLQRMAVEDQWQTTDAALFQAVPVRGPAQLKSTVEEIAPILRLVKTTTSEEIRQQAAGVLGEIGANHPETVDLLVELLQSEKAETRWQAAISLGKVAPDHPLSGIRRAKLIDLGLQLDHYSIALIVAIMPTAGDRIAVFLQVQSVDQRLDLPPQLKISVLSESGETRLQAEARSDAEFRGKDKSIDLRFSPPIGSRFQVKVELNDICVTEEFVT